MPGFLQNTRNTLYKNNFRENKEAIVRVIIFIYSHDIKLKAELN